MSDFYDEMQEVATDLLQEFSQGQVTLKRTVTTPGEHSYDPPTETVTSYALKATVRRVNQRFDRGTVIVETGDVVTFAALEVEPALTDLLVVDGKDRAITDLKRIPAAGTVVAWQAFIAA